MESTPISDIHHAFLSAFSDYAVKTDMPLEKFIGFVKGSSVDVSLSAGSFENGELCGFVLNGVREAGGILTVYDSGTGVVPQYRKQGITKGMFAFALPLLKEKGVKRYVLEVIQTNAAALNLYKGLRFSVTRELICLKARKEKLNPVYADNIRMIPAAELDVHMCAAMHDFIPTWQNSFDSVSAAPGLCAAAVAEQRGEIAGYGVINIQSGRVYQLAVKKELRGQGIGSALICMISRQTQAENISFLNVDSGCKSMLSFLDKLGFTEYVRQYEMELEI